MADLIGRNLDDRISQALKVRTARPEGCAGSGDRALLQQALRARQQGLGQVLAAMPRASPDGDGAGIRDLADRRNVDCAELGRQADVSVHWLPSCP